MAAAIPERNSKMAKKRMALPPIPADTASVASLVFEDGNEYLTVGNHHRSLFAHLDFTLLYSDDRLVTPLPVLALVTVFQYVEQLSDDEVVEAVRTRIDWEYALHLSLDSPDIDLIELVDFHRRLSDHANSCAAFDALLARVQRLTPFWPWPSHAPNTAAVVASLQALNDLPIAVKALWLALEALAAEAPDWLGKRGWLAGRYRKGHGWLHLPTDPRDRELLTLAVAEDGHRLLAEASGHDAPDAVSSLAELAVLGEVWRWKFAGVAGTKRAKGCSGGPPAVPDTS